MHYFLHCGTVESYHSVQVSQIRKKHITSYSTALNDWEYFTFQAAIQFAEVHCSNCILADHNFNNIRNDIHFNGTGLNSAHSHIHVAQLSGAIFAYKQVPA